MIIEAYALKIVAQILVFAGGVLLGMIIRDMQYRKIQTFGIIDLNYTDPNKPTFTLKIDDLSDLEDKNGVYCKIVRSK